MAAESFYYGDPFRALMRKGQSCHNCSHLQTWQIADKSVTACTNIAAPQNRRERAPDRRCWQFSVTKGNPDAK